MQLAFIGLGKMGLPMAINLAKVYPTVYGVNRSKGKEEEFARAGGKVGRSITQLAGRVDVMMTCLPQPEDVEQVYLGEGGIVAHGRPGLICIDFSTVSPRLSRKIYSAAEEKEIDFLDIPVSGGPWGAEAGTLSMMAGGKEAAFYKVREILEVLGEKIYYVGPSGSGSAVKLINQLMVSIHTQAVAEALLLAKSFGLDAETTVDILNNSYAQSRILKRHYTQFISQEQYEPGFSIRLLRKDTRLVQEMAKERDLVLPVSQLADQLLAEAEERGYAEKDMSSIYRFMDEKTRQHDG